MRTDTINEDQDKKIIYRFLEIKWTLYNIKKLAVLVKHDFRRRKP